MTKLRVGILGCGAISKAYLESLTGPLADAVEVVALADLMEEARQTRSEEFGVPAVETPEAMLADDTIDLVLNLTPAPAHAETNHQILDAGKHLYTEKPLALSMNDGRALLEKAKANNLRLAAAPDTVLGAGVQTARALLDEGKIGTPNLGFARVIIQARGERYMRVFRGALLDLGPYPIGALIHLLGPAKSVVGHAVEATWLEAGDPGRTLDAPARATASIEFAGGCLVTLAASNDTPLYTPTLGLFGDTGLLDIPDPNKFSGELTLTANWQPPETIAMRTPHTDNLRGLGVWDIAHAIAEDRPHRLSAESALHSLEIMLAVIESAKTGRRVDLQTTCDRPGAMVLA